MRAGRSLIPGLPLNATEATDGQAYYDELLLPDGIDGDAPRLGDATGEWFREIVRVAFGSWDPTSGVRSIRDIFLLAPKGQSKTTYAAGLILAVMIMNRRRNCQALFVGPTQSISDRAYEQAVGIITPDRAAERRFKMIDHEKTIEDQITGAEMKVKTFDVNILTGSILIFALIDELHLLGRSPHTTKVLRQIRGGLDKTPEGLLLITTTQSDDRPAGTLAPAVKFVVASEAGLEITTVCA
jgi:phage terminase large subunit-like protein